MVLLLAIAFVAGAITAVSPCVLPVLPIVLAGGAAGGRRRPLAVAGGLTLAFGTLTLFAAWLLDRLGLPRDALRDLGIALLLLVAASLLVPRLAVALERPLARLTRLRPPGDVGGFVLGLGLGLVFVPCGGPVLAAIATNADRYSFGWRTLAASAAYAVGVGVTMLALGLGGQRALARTRLLRERAPQVRAALGVVVAASAIAIAVDLDTRAQTALGDWTSVLQRHTEETAAARRALARLRPPAPRRAPAFAALGPELADFGPVPDFQGISAWLNTPGERPLTMRRLRGNVVLVDFWTYSCINCLRTLPYLEAWYRRYARDGFVVVGVHTPEFAFEHELANVRAAVRELGVRYPVALDNRAATWSAYYNQYWPAEYLIDRRGHLRHARFGEGGYGRTETLIRTLLAESGPRLPPPLGLRDRTPTGLLTPETYLGSQRLERYAGSPLRPGRLARYQLPSALGPSEVAYGGWWRVEPERIVAGRDASLRLRFRARSVHLVLGGRGVVGVRVDGSPVRRLRVDEDRLYTLVAGSKLRDRLLELRVTPGLSAYAFTFG